MTEVYKSAGLSPGVSAKQRGIQLDCQHKCKKEIQSSVAFKRRCLVLKSEQSSKETASEVREGDTYVSNIGHEKDIPDITEIPSAATTMLSSTKYVTYVTFHLETGGFSDICHY